MWRLSGIAVVFVVLLRIAIGWQFVYEGMWKLNTYSSAKPWTAAGYLRNARGPLRDFYRGMTGNPDDLHWLDYERVSHSWDQYRDAFVVEHPDLTEAQKLRLSEILDGPAQFTVPLAKLPAGVKFSGSLAKVVSYDADNKLLAVDGKLHLLPKEKAELVRMAKSVKNANTADVQRFQKALDQIYRQSAKLSFKERLAVLLKIDPERVGIAYHDDKTKEVVEQRKGKITEYQELLKRYNDELPRAHQAFEHQHLDMQWGEIQKLRAELVNPVLRPRHRFQAGSAKTADEPATRSRTRSRAVDAAAEDRPPDDLGSARDWRTVDDRSGLPGGGDRRGRASLVVLSRNSPVARRRRFAGGRGPRT